PPRAVRSGRVTPREQGRQPDRPPRRLGAMGQGTSGRSADWGAGSVRIALLGGAAAIVVAVAVALVLAGVTSGEVAATVLFLPVFAAGFLGGRPAGYGVAALATAAYVALRRADLADAGAPQAAALV